MPSPTDPILVLRRRAWIIRGLTVAALVPAAIWAMRPSPPDAQPDTSLATASLPAATEPSPDRLLVELDPKVFTARLWNPPPAPPPPDPAPPAASESTKPDVTLVAVINQSSGSGESHGEGKLRAALYDPAEQRVRVLDLGATIRQYTIANITQEGVTLQEGQRTHELRLREVPPPSPLTLLIDDSMPQARADP